MQSNPDTPDQSSQVSSLGERSDDSMEVQFNIDRREFRIASRYFGRRMWTFWMGVLAVPLLILMLAFIGYVRDLPLELLFTADVIVAYLVIAAWMAFFAFVLPELAAFRWSPKNRFLTRISPERIQTERLIHGKHGKSQQTSSYGWAEVKKIIEYRGFLILFRPARLITFSDIIPKRAFNSPNSYASFKDRSEKWHAASKKTS